MGGIHIQNRVPKNGVLVSCVGWLESALGAARDLTVDAKRVSTYGGP